MSQRVTKSYSVILTQKLPFQVYATKEFVCRQLFRRYHLKETDQSSKNHTDDVSVKKSVQNKVFKSPKTQISKYGVDSIKEFSRDYQSDVGTNKIQINPKMSSERVEIISELKSFKHYNIKSFQAAISSIQNNYKNFFNNIYNYFEDITRLNQVQQARERVLNIHKEIVNTAATKRDLILELDRIRKELNDFYTDMDKSFTRSPEKFVELAQQKAELCTKEKELATVFNEVDTKERILHNEFIFAINDSFEKEKQHTSFLRVLGLFGTLLSTLISLLLYIRKDHQIRIEIRQIENLLSSTADLITEKTNKQLVHLIDELKGQKKVEHAESWGSYLKRHVRWVYSWAYRS